ncbi:hypothetical protein EB061_06165 [bacterium]|nr:hypothetical protein [bacterium]
MSLFFTYASLLLGVFLWHPASAEVSPDRAARLRQMRDQTLVWAFLAEDGGLATNHLNDQGDMVERAGFLCLFGMVERCQDVRTAQAPDGRFYRARQYIGVSRVDAFSRDHFNGVMAYYIATKDEDSARRYLGYLETHRFRLCEKSSDNRCIMTPETWGIIGRVWRHNGWSASPRLTRKMKWGMRVDGAGIVVGSFSPLGFESVLPAWTGILRRKLDSVNDWVRLAMKIAVRRQPENAFVRFARDGATDEVADLTLNACNGVRGRGDYDFIWNRRLFRKHGRLYVDSGAGREKPVEDASDGWDCILMAQMLLSPENTVSPVE